MVETQRFAERDVVARHYEYADGDVLAFDLGAGRDGAVDVVEGTLLVVDDDDEQFEVDLPVGHDAQATINNGVVTIEVHGPRIESDGTEHGTDEDPADTEDDSNR